MAAAELSYDVWGHALGFSSPRELATAAAASRTLAAVAATEHLWSALWGPGAPPGGGSARDGVAWRHGVLHAELRFGTAAAMPVTGFPVHIQCFTSTESHLATAAGGRVLIWDYDLPHPPAAPPAAPPPVPATPASPAHVVGLPAGLHVTCLEAAGSLVVVGTSSGALLSLSPASGAVARARPLAHDGQVQCMCVPGPSAEAVYTGGDDGAVRAFDVATLQPLLELWGCHAGTVTCLRAGGGVVVSGGTDGRVRVWDAGSAASAAASTGGAWARELDAAALVVKADQDAGAQAGGLGVVRCLDYDAEGDGRVLCGCDGVVVGWDLSPRRGGGAGGKGGVAAACAHSRPIRSLRRLGRVLVTCAGDYSLRLWDVGCWPRAVMLRAIDNPSGSPVACFGVVRGRLLFSSLFNQSITVCHFVSGGAAAHPDADE